MTAPPTAPKTTPVRAPRIVGIGASAGGLEALEQFFSQIPRHSDLAYVVVQHLDPTHKALLTELLQRCTWMRVEEVSLTTAVEADVVYVIPPNAELTVANGRLHLATPAQPRGLRLPIDVLFSSLARDQGERAIGIVLSGMGSDGTLGLQAIRSQGGLTLAQEPASAQFDSMPKSAIASGAVDIVAPPGALPGHVLRIVKGIAGAAQPSALPVGGSVDHFGQILSLLRERRKHDFTSYKPSTLTRRMERRVGVHGLKDLAEYARFVRDNPAELDLLLRELLIGVTSFFRDAAVWQELKESVIPDLLRRRTASTRLRAWVVGCSTGEEADSLAMAFTEVISSLPNRPDWSLQIFATDLSADAIAAARRGFFTISAAEALGQARVARFFSSDGSGIQIDKKIRDMVLFAEHDVILDPPFTKLDMLFCRNVMIYFNASLQHSLLKLFHYALNESGVLVLGESESIGRSQHLFASIGAKSRLFRRSEGPLSILPAEFPVGRGKPIAAHALEVDVTTPPNGRTNLQSLADQLILRELAPAAVLVNRDGDVLYINGRTGKYLEPAAGKANWNVHVMTRPAIRTQLAAALRKVAQERGAVQFVTTPMEDEGNSIVSVTVQTVARPPALAGTVLIVFRDVATKPEARARHKKGADHGNMESLDELVRSRDEIRLLRAEMSTAEEERQAAMEELQSANEELQSANEELTTSKEEAQSMNEELQTINAELQSKLDDLALAQSDMQNLLNSTDIGTLFLDNELRIRRYTERVTRIIPLRDSDIGRPLADMANTLCYPDLLVDAADTARTLKSTEKQIATTDGLWYSVRVMPYRTLANVAQGIVITFVDITAAKELESKLRQAV